MIVGIQDEILKIQALGLLDKLLEDKTTKSNIIWATDAYKDKGKSYERDQEMKAALITGANSGIIRNRARKALEQQTERTRQHAEVFTPLWICKKMNDVADEGWLANGKEGAPGEKVSFEAEKTWQQYVDARRLEITCGEAPYLVSRYDVSTGESIPIEKRIGLLDRKLKVVEENTADEEEWLAWATRAFQSIYGYEFQGDNLLIARVNLLMTFEEYMEMRWKRKPTRKEFERIVNIISWNIWQMDGLTGTIPYCKADEEDLQMSIFDFFFADDKKPEEQEKTQPKSKTYDWRRGNSLVFSSLGERRGRKMKFDFIIGNPPYQEDVENNGRSNPIYHHFMDESYKIADVVELIHPARFLFNAGQTPKTWNKKMLSDEHFKVLMYEGDSSVIFPNTDIKGGVAITMRNARESYGAIGTFSYYPELKTIQNKVDFEKSLTDIIVGAVPYRFTDVMREEKPETVELIHSSYDLRTNVLDNLNNIVFFDCKPNEEHDYVQIFGLYEKKRAYKWIDRRYLTAPDNFESYRVFVPESNGSGAIGEVLSTPVIGHTQTFISIGCFETFEEAEALMKYVKSKFARTMLGILKITQHNPRATWRYVPLQNFTSTSDIDWSGSISQIDQQLYAKYGLDEKEIAFIESHVKEMN